MASLFVSRLIFLFIYTVLYAYHLLLYYIQIKPGIVREGVSALCGTQDKLSRVYK